MAPVRLIQMPFAAVERPSLGLGLLSARLQKAGIPTNVEYANLEFAARLGLSRYRLVEVTRNDDLLGEWIFAPAAFGTQLPDAPDFLDHVDLSAALSRFGSLNKIHDCFRELRSLAVSWIEDLAQRLAAQGPRILGASSMFQQHCASLAVLRRVKELNPRVVTMLGGANCDGVMGQATFAAFDWLDYVVCGEADEVVVELMRHALDPAIHPVPAGVLSRTGRLATVEPVVALDNLDTPDFDDYFRQLQDSGLGPQVSPGLLIETSRGCWWGQKHHCTFCGLNASGMAFRSKTAPRILEELEQLSRRYHLQQVELTDNILAMQRFQDLLPQLSEHNYTLFAEVKANLNRQHLEGLARAGVRWIQPGLENLDDRVLKIMDKGTSAAVNLQLLKWAREFGVFVSWNFLVGFPGEQDEWYAEMSTWLKWLVHLQPPQGVFRARYDRYSPYQGKPESYGLRLRPHPAYAALYPVGPELLQDLAYFHLGEEQEWGPQLWDPHHMGPGLGALQTAAEHWGQAFWAELPAILSMQDDGRQLTILDTRPAALARRHSFTGCPREIYLACDSARTSAALARQLECSLEEVEWELANFCRPGLMLALPEGRYLALAVAGSLPRLLRPDEFPGGSCNLAL